MKVLHSFLAVVAFSTPSIAASVDFMREVQPILSEHCFHCHGQDEKTREGGLRLDTREGALQGGESDGPAFVAGRPDASALIARITAHDDDIMPPVKAKNPLKHAQVEVLKRWITEGAKYEKHWAFEPPIKAASGDKSAVDALVTAKLKPLGLDPSPPADAATLCRRLHLDLIGLPPSPADVAAFKDAHQSRGSQAIQELITKLMKSPQFGEKWARHWLDSARYSDSNGYEKDLPREQWAWREWGIRALNDDMPYDRFVIEQLAGDLLPNATQDQIVATGFLRNSMVNEEGAIVPEQFRMDEMFDRIDCLGKAVLGLSVQCAQCHSHKFDPISQEEYFGIFAFLNNSYEAQSWVYSPEQQKQALKVKTDIRAVEERLKKSRPQWQQELAAWEAGILKQQVEWTPLTATELGSTSGLNHPTQLDDKSVLTQGHPTTNGDIFVIAEPELRGITGLRLEALTHADFPFDGPGRSRYGTWAVSEMEVSVRPPGAKEWQKLKLTNASADFSEPAAPLEPEWKANFDPDHRRTRGPVAFMMDGDNNTGWRADRGLGRRNQESVAVVQFEKPLDFPPKTELKVLLRYQHSDASNGRGNTQIGRCRLSTTKAAAPKAVPVDYAAILALHTPAEKRTSAQREAIFTAWRTSRADCKAFNDEIASAWKAYPEAKTSVLHLAEREGEFTRQTHLLDRGGWDRPKQVIASHTPAALHPMKPGAKPDRLALAEWIVDPRSPLTARVAVNRVWQAVFGSGLVETSEDFGTRAAVPEHREVLDWLAVDFMEHGWSQKHLIKTILSTATYQQSSRTTPAMLERDPRNRLLTRGPRFRLEAEVIRDSALSIAGLLTLKVGGPSIFPPVPQSVLDFNYFKPDYWLPAEGPERYRRALYVFRKRSMPDPALSNFDAPNGDLACARRPRSNTPLSALTSLNEPIFVEAAQALAQRVLREGGADDAARADYAYQLCTARPIKPEELQSVLELLDEYRARLRKGELKAGQVAFSSFTKLDNLPVDATPNDIAAWTIISRVLLNLDETMTKS